MAWRLVLLAGLLTGTAAAHPGIHLDLSITVTDESLQYGLLFSNELVGRFAPPQLDRDAFTYDGTDFSCIDPAHQARVENALTSLLEDLNPVTIDDLDVAPIIDRVTFVSAVEPLGIDQAPDLPPDVLVTIRYPCKGRPGRISMTWDLFVYDPRAVTLGNAPKEELVAVMDVFDQRKVITFTPDEPTCEWIAPNLPAGARVASVAVVMVPATIPLPIVSLLLVVGLVVATVLSRRLAIGKYRSGAIAAAWLLGLLGTYLARGTFAVDLENPWQEVVRVPSQAEAEAVFTSLHRNVYRAFDYKSESDVYDVLARSVGDDLLEQVYNEVYQNLVFQDQGGAVARIKSVDIIETGAVSLSEAEPGAFDIPAKWRVSGVVCHWGHTHTRINEYQAVYTVAPRDKAWKVTGVEVLSSERITANPSTNATP